MTSYIMTLFSTKCLITQKLQDFKGWCNWLFWSVCCYQPEFWHFIKFKPFLQLFPRVSSSLFISLIWPGTIHFIIGFSSMCHYQILCQIKHLCLRSIEELTNSCVHKNTRKVYIASYGNQSLSSVIYNFGHSVHGRAIGS